MIKSFDRYLEDPRRSTFQKLGANGQESMACMARERLPW